MIRRSLPWTCSGVEAGFRKRIMLKQKRPVSALGARHLQRPALAVDFPARQSAWVLDRLEQHVPLLAKRELDHALWREMRRRERHLFVRDCVVVHPQPAVLDLAARLAVRSDQARFDERRKNTKPGF